MVAVTSKRVLGPFTRSRALTVHNFSFVVPVYDYRSVDDLAPALDNNGVGWQVFVWNEDNNSFESDGELYDDIDEARREAELAHDELRQSYEISENRGTNYYVEDFRIDEEESASPAFSLTVTDLELGEHGMPVMP